MKKFLLPGMMAALTLAACTNEEIVSQQTVAPEVNFGDRPVVGMVDLGFNAKTRATLATDENFNTLVWTENDSVGARLIDKQKSSSSRIRFNHYEGDDQNAYTNYLYKKVAGQELWTSEALMVEGNYMFYAPYNEKARQRDPLSVKFPLKQVVNLDDAGVEGVEANTSAIKSFYENKDGYIYALGHAFISSEEDVTVIEPTMTHLYAYPQITLKNAYTVDEDGLYSTESDAVGQSITIDKIYVTAPNLRASYKALHTNFIGKLNNYYEVPYVENGQTKKEIKKAGAWRNAVKRLRNARTSDILMAQGSTQAEIEIDFEPNLVLADGEEFAFHMVLPAEVYGSENKLSIDRVVLEGSKTFYSKWNRVEKDVDYTTIKDFAPAAYSNSITSYTLTYSPQTRYAVQEYNFTASNATLKSTAGELATFKLGGHIGDYVAPTGIENLVDFENYLMKLNDNTKNITEKSNSFFLAVYGEDEANESATDNKIAGYAKLELSKAVLDLMKEYLDGGKINFVTPMVVSGDLDASNSALGSVADLKQLEAGKTINLSGVEVKGNAEFKGNVTVGSITGDATFGGTATVNGTIGGNATFGGTATINKDAQICKNATFGGNATVSGTIGSVDRDGNTVGGNATFNGADSEVTVKGEILGAVVINGAAVEFCESGIEGFTSALGTSVAVHGNGSLNLKKAYTNSITVGGKAAGANTVSDGTLSINADIADAKVALVQGSVVNNATVNFAVGATNWWTAGTLTNNNKITSAITVPAAATYVHGENAVATVAKVEAAATVGGKPGKVQNYGDLTVTTNNGLIEVKEPISYTTVKGGTGEVNNTKLGVVYDESTNKDHTVYYETTAEIENDEVWEKINASSQNEINKLVIAHKWTVNEGVSDGTETVFTVPAYDVIEFKSNLDVVDVTMSFNSATEVVLGADSQWRGREVAKSVVDGMKSVKENGYKWTVSYLTLGASYRSNVLDYGGTIKLVADETFASAHVLTHDVTLDLNGHTLTVTNEKAFTLSDNVTLTIKNGKIKSDKQQIVRLEGENAVLNVESEAELEASSYTITTFGGDKTLNINGKVTATAAATAAIATNGNNAPDNVNVIIDGATITSNGGEGSLALLIAANGDVTIKNNSKLFGYDSALEQRGEGTLAINGGLFVASTTQNFKPDYDGDGSNIVGAAVAVNNHKGRVIDVEITGNPVFSSAAVDGVAFYEGNNSGDKNRNTVNEFTLGKSTTVEGTAYSTTNAIYLNYILSYDTDNDTSTKNDKITGTSVGNTYYRFF